MTSSSSTLKGTPQQTEGPYFVDGMPNRSDIRSDPSDGSVQQGIPLYLIIHVYDVDNGSCLPVRGAKVDIWHANPQGIYSGIKNLETAGKEFLRGYQTTDNNGTVKFTRIYPGWYEGRTIHIHDEVRTFNGTEKTMEWTSQLYFNNSINQDTHKHPPYSNHGPPQTSNEEDIVYKGPSNYGLVKRDSGKEMMLNTTKQGQSYVSTFSIVLNASRPNH